MTSVFRRARARTLAHKMRQHGSNALFVLPSTLTNLDAAFAYASVSPCRILAGRLVNSHPGATQARDCIAYGSALVRDWAKYEAFPFAVFSFPDQCITNGPGHETLDFLGRPRRWSVIEALLITRHRPTVWVNDSCARWRDLRKVDNTEVSKAKSVPDLMQIFLAPLEKAAGAGSAKWLAHQCVEDKSVDRHALHAIQELTDLEAICRMWVRETKGECEGASTVLETISATRKRACRTQTT